MSACADRPGEKQAAGHAEAGSKIQWVPVGLLLAGDSPRLKGENAQHIRMLANSEVSLPAILVHRETMRVVDGMHRLRATLMKGQETIEVQFFEGSEDEAFIRAIAANTEHGLPLTLADRRAAAARITVSHPRCSDRWIAQITGLASGTVATIRRRTSPDDGQITARIGRDGRVRPLSSADGRRIAAAAITENPQASLREIARAARISYSTARDVRQRLRLGQDPILTRQARGPREPEAIGHCPAPDDNQAQAARTMPRDPAALLQSLRKDPSLRFSESGRDLLRWLGAWTRGPSRWQELIESTPPHCAYLLAELARSCADEWLEFASELERRQRGRA